MLLISNPVAGAGKGPEFIQHHVLPLLEGLELNHVTTKAAGDAGIIAVEYAKPRTHAVIIISGGDGTLHEVINALAPLEEIKNRSKSVEFIVLPLGTANALYSWLFPPNEHKHLEITHPAYKLLSLRSYLDNQSDNTQGKLIPLAVQSTDFLDASGQVVHNIFSAVVTSTSLHASILDTANRLVKERPDLVGVERFKVAAAENITNWYYASVKLNPFGKSDKCLKYNPSSRQFEPCNAISLDGPFEYFLSTANVDRLEPDFVITPLSSKLPSPGETQQYTDIVIIRPFRSPALKSGVDNEENRKSFVNTSIAVLQHAYKDGAHVDLLYADDGSCTEEGNGEPIVEYFRCGGWEWVPKEGDDLAQLTCADGTIIKIPTGGKAVCKLLTGDGGMKIGVWG